jgi:hypothetical protein
MTTQADIPDDAPDAAQARRARRTAWDRHKRRMVAYGRWTPPYVDAGPARQRLRELQAAGIGWRRAAELAGLDKSIVSSILYGKTEREPARRIRPRTEAAILALQPSADLARPGAKVAATGTHRRIQALVAAGYPLAEIARQLGKDPRGFGRLLEQPTVVKSTAESVQRLYQQIWDQPPPQDGFRPQTRAEQARRLADRRGWAPPLAWDDEDLDRPEGRPAEGWQRKSLRGSARAAVLSEDAFWLMRQLGLTREQAAERMGVRLDILNRAISQARREAAPAAEQEQAEHCEQRARFAQAAAGPEAAKPEAEAG